MSLRDRKKLTTRNALIETSRRLFAEKGYDNTTLEEICDEVQIHVTTFFSYFSNKEELAFAKLYEVLNEFRTELQARPEGVDVMSFWWGFIDRFSLQERGKESTIMMSGDDVAVLRNGYANINRLFGEEIARALALEAGEDPRTDLYSQLLAANVMASVVSASLWHRRKFGADAYQPDTNAFARMIAARFPSRSEFQVEERRFLELMSHPQGATDDGDAG